MTNTILIVTCIVSFLAFQNHSVLDKLIFSPYLVQQRREWYRFFSSGLIHADWLHLIVNMFVLYTFGRVVEDYYLQLFGSRAMVNFLLLYIGGLGMSILPTYSKQRNNPGYHALGASGAVSAIVFSFILFNPLQRLCFYGILCLPGILFGILYLIYCYYMGKRGKDNINHDAHLWGALYGFFFTIVLKPSLIVSFFDQLIYFRNAI